MAEKNKIIEIISNTTFYVMKEIINSGEKLSSLSMQEELINSPEILKILNSLKKVKIWKERFQNIEGDFEVLSQEHERVVQEKKHLIKKLERFDDIDSSSDTFYKKILILFCEVLRSSDNRSLDLHIKEFKSLLKKNADKTLLEKSFNQIKDTIITETEDDLQSLKNKKKGKSLGILGKWVKTEEISRGDGEIEHALKLTQMFQDLIDEFKLIFVNEYLEKLLTIEKVMLNASNIDEFNIIGKSIVDLLQEYIANVNSDREQTSLFIKEISKKVIDIDSIITESFSSFNDSESSHDNFHEFLESNISDLEKSVNVGKTIEELRTSVGSRLSVINESIRKQKLEAVSTRRDSDKRFSRLAGYFGKMKKNMEFANKKAKILEKELNIDPLTGAANRRAYKKRMVEEMDRFLRYNTIFSVLIFDIDHFKEINDNYGHSIGDICLKEIIKRVKKLLRKSDLLARFGGDEFVVFMPETDKKGVIDAAQRFLQTVEKIEFLHRDEKVKITISIGATQVQKGDKRFSSVFNRMDSALYEAKDNGRNIVVFK
jgi:diguanylate cyclase (GGDEF)-like protein